MPKLSDSLSADLISTTKKPAYISGKRMTATVLLVLLATGLLFYWVTMAYGDYNAARRQTDRAWRELAAELDTRYRALETTIVLAKDEQKVEPSAAQQWEVDRDVFSGTSQALRQIEAAVRLEHLLASLPPEVRSSRPPSDRLSQLANAYAAAAANQREVGRTFGSRLLKTMLNLPEPTEFQLAN